LKAPIKESDLIFLELSTSIVTGSSHRSRAEQLKSKNRTWKEGEVKQLNSRRRGWVGTETQVSEKQNLEGRGS
jgi:hypothetical protein